MQKYIILSLSFLLLGCNSCIVNMNWFGLNIKGSGNIINESRELGDFHTVNLLGSMDVNIVAGNTYSCNVKGDDNLMPLLKTTVHDNILEISIEGSYSTNSSLVIYLEMPVLEKAYIAGSGEMTITDVTKDKVIFNISGSGDITASGKVEVLEASVSGSGDLRLGNLHANHANVIINGSGDANVWVEQSISAQVNGSGDILYTGNPAEVNKQVNGSGDITKR